MISKDKIVIARNDISKMDLINNIFINMFFIIAFVGSIFLPLALISYFKIDLLLKLLIVIFLDVVLFLYWWKKAGIFNYFKMIFQQTPIETILSKSGIQIKYRKKVKEYNWNDCLKMERCKYLSDDETDYTFQTLLDINNHGIIEIEEDATWENYNKIKDFSNVTLKESGPNTYKWNEKAEDFIKV